MKLETKNLKLVVLLALAIFHMPLATCDAAQREISRVWKVDTGPAKKEPLTWFAGDTVQLNLTSVQNGAPINLTGAVLVWELRGWSDYTNLYAVTTGTVVSATNGQSRFELSGDQTANLPETCLGYARAVQTNGVGVVLGWQTIRVEWADTTGQAAVATPLPSPFITDAELAALAAIVSTNTARIEALEARSNVWNEAYGWGDHALEGYLTEESDPAWHAGTNALWAAILSNLTSAAFGAYTNEQYAITTNHEERITELENRPVSDTNLAAIVTQATNDIAEIKAVTNDWTVASATVAGNSNVWNLAEGAVQETDADYTQTVFRASIAVLTNSPNYTNSLLRNYSSGTYGVRVGGMVSSGKLEVGDQSAKISASSGIGSSYVSAGLESLTIHCEDEVDEPNPVYIFGEVGITGSLALNGGSAITSFDQLMPGGYETVSNLAAGAVQEEVDPLWLAESGAVYQAIADAAPGGYATVSNLAVSAVQTEVDPVAMPALSNLVSGTDGFSGILLDTRIESWEDIGLTYTNAVRLNPAITISNDAQWSGWTTTGTLDTNTHTILLASTNEYLLSPVQSNGIAHISYSAYSAVNATSYDFHIATNGVSVGAAPWNYDNGQVYFRPTGCVPGTTLGLYISNVTIIAYSDLAEAQIGKQVSSLCVISDPVVACDVANKAYVDDAEADAVAYTDGTLAAYAADATKTVRGAELRLGNMWVVSPADTSGDRFIFSGGEISGDGTLIGTTNEFVLSKNDYPLMSFTSESSGLFCTNFLLSTTASNATWTLYVATNGVHSAPYAEWTDSLIVGDWSRVVEYETETYPTASNGTYTLKFTVPAGGVCYVRAMQAEGDSVATINADVLDVGIARLLLTDMVNSNRYRIAVSNGTIIAIEE